MAKQVINGVRLAGISASVPSKILNNLELDLLGDMEDRKRFVQSVGIGTRHVVSDGLTTSDLCLDSAERLIGDLDWATDSIDCLVFVTQTPDYQLPSTACILQARLGLPESCFAIQLSLGCSGWVYGLSTISSLLASGGFKRGLLLVGDTVTVTKSPFDKATFPLFGDAGTATALEVDVDARPMFFDSGTDGSGFKSIIIEDGGYRNPVTSESFEMKEFPDGSKRNGLQSYLNGQDVFIFGITKAPRSLKNVLEFADVSCDALDFLILHQANKLMLEKIAKKLKIEMDRVPLSLDEFGNTSSASIPLTMVTRIGDALSSKSRLKLAASGFGVGLSWASVVLDLNDLVVSSLKRI